LLLAQHVNRRESEPGAARFLRFSEAQEVISRFLSSGQGALVSTELRDASTWDRWIRARDDEVRGRIDRGAEDSISNLILYGTSYTQLPRLESLEQAASAGGEVTEPARARIQALRLALANPGDNERVRFVSDYLTRHGVSDGAIESFLSANLRRFIAEQRGFQEKLRAAGQATDPGELLSTRGRLFEKRGLSVDTSLLPNFALADTLRSLVGKAVLAPGSVRRIAVVGPGLDFTDKRDGYDFYPLQTIQPFAVLEGVLRLKLAEPGSVQVVTFDLNPFVNEHVKRLAERGRAGRPYVLQLPRDTEAGWNSEAVAYWQRFGEIIGWPTRPLPLPSSLGNVILRAVSIHPRYAAQLEAVDLNIVAQTLDLSLPHGPNAVVGAGGGVERRSPLGRGFDLVVATNVLVYYDRLQQALAMASIAHMMNSGGVFLANTVLPAQHPPELEYLGRRSVSYSVSGAYGDDVVVYRRK
jgi:hypothetical protein